MIERNFYMLKKLFIFNRSCIYFCFVHKKNILEISISTIIDQINFFLVKRPWLMFLFTVGLLFIFNISVAQCATSDDVYSSSNKDISLSEEPSLAQAAKANRAQCHSNLNIQILPPNATQNMSINEQIIRAHISVQIALQNISVEQNRLLQDLLFNDALYNNSSVNHLITNDFYNI